MAYIVRRGMEGDAELSTSLRQQILRIDREGMIYQPHIARQMTSFVPNMLVYSGRRI